MIDAAEMAPGSSSLQPNHLGIGCCIQIDEDHLKLPVYKFEDVGKLRPVYGYLPVAV